MEVYDQPLLGFRKWEFDERNKLLMSCTQGIPWQPGVNYATGCSDHSSPGESCHCGFNGWFDIEDNESSHYSGIIGSFAAAGNVEIHEQGFRSEEAQIIALLVSRSQKKSLATTAKRYGIRLFTDRKKFIEFSQELAIRKEDIDLDELISKPRADTVKLKQEKDWKPVIPFVAAFTVSSMIFAFFSLIGGVSDESSRMPFWLPCGITVFFFIVAFSVARKSFLLGGAVLILAALASGCLMIFSTNIYNQKWDSLHLKGETVFQERLDEIIEISLKQQIDYRETGGFQNMSKGIPETAALDVKENQFFVTTSIPSDKSDKEEKGMLAIKGTPSNLSIACTGSEFCESADITDDKMLAASERLASTTETTQQETLKEELEFNLSRKSCDINKRASVGELIGNEYLINIDCIKR